ncbi:MAG: septum formation initiator family protein [Eubacterium sp.]|jgi:cell division protein DivIC|uniref:FtsB family cell division protein n=1 Tax=Eubacterium sp. F2 TaxID=3381348 RepID=UPI003907F527|nr:septum formation initiator family protein [Eubacterium sp.]MCI2196944.1 septum formation initiator family protein [Eubacterium sp.]
MSAKNTRSRRKKKKVRINPSRMVLTLIMVLLLGASGVSVHTVLQLQSEQNRLKSKNTQLKTKRSELQEELKSVNKDSYIEQQARTQLHMIKPGEVVYVLKDNSSGSSKSGNSSSSK